MIKFFFDTETTGRDPELNTIHELGGTMITPEGSKSIELFFRPDPDDLIEPAALAVSGKTLRELRGYPPKQESYKALLDFLVQYVDPYKKSPKHKIFLYGYNVKFDEGFLRALFTQMGNNFFGSYFWTPSIDVMTLAGEALAHERIKLDSFGQFNVARHLGIEVDNRKEHSALDDSLVTLEIYNTLMEKKHG